MASSLPTQLIEKIDSCYIAFGARVEEARKAHRESAPGAERRRAKQRLALLEAEQAGMLDIVAITHNFEAQQLTRAQLYHGTGFAPDALFIQVR